jgi:Fur family ferric uptake transcriptional regulator
VPSRNRSTAAPVDDLDLSAQLRARGYRLTPQRQLVLEAVQALEHGTPDEVAGRVQERAAGVNISTVYRTLELLEELGLVRHSHLGHGAPIYHASTVPDHVHLVCRGCGSIQEVDPAAVGSLVSRLHDERGFQTDVGHLTVFGTCAECASDA